MFSSVTPSSTRTSLPNTGSLTSFEEKRLNSALTMLDDPYILEQNVARYVLILLNKFFPYDIWNIVPQYYTYSGKIPDLVLETYLDRGEHARNKIFAASVYIELKSSINTKSAIQQVIGSIHHQYGKALFSRGYLIGVQGTKWTIMEYHFVQIKDGEEVQNKHKNKVDLLYLNFYEDMVDKTLHAKRPIPSMHGSRPLSSRQYKNFDSMDLESPEETLDLLKALKWIANENKGRDLTSIKDEAKTLSLSLSVSTLSSQSDEPEYGVSETNQDFNHVIQFFKDENLEMVYT